MKSISTLIVFIYVNSSIVAQDITPIQTDRPDQTESSFLVPKKYLQTELGFTYESNHTNEANLEHPAILVKYGLSNRFEYRFISNIYTDINNKKWTWHWNEIGIGLKTKLTDEHRFIPQSSLIMHYSVIWDKKNKNIKLSPDFRFTFLHSLRSNLNLSYNVGLQWNIESNRPTYLYTLSLSYAINEHIGAYIESYAFYERFQLPNNLIDGGGHLSHW